MNATPRQFADMIVAALEALSAAVDIGQEWEPDEALTPAEAVREYAAFIESIASDQLGGLWEKYRAMQAAVAPPSVSEEGPVH